MAGHEAFSNTTEHIAVPIVEGGFLSGRNPFEFNPALPLSTFSIQLVIILSMSRFIKFLLSPIRQPNVIAEIISGIILGPTVLGHIPHYTETIFPKPSLPFLHLMSNFGLVLFLFMVGLELDPKMLKKSMKRSLTISLAGMALPFGVGTGVSYALHTLIESKDNHVDFLKYCLFLGVAMAITAFPVLARILTELGLLKTEVGRITISAAAVDDATSWCLLALVISLINAGSMLTALYVFLIGLGYSIFVLVGFRPIYIWILKRNGAFSNEPTHAVMFVTLCVVFISAFITDAIGIHAIFGGFLAGIMCPHEGGFAYKITQKIEDIVSVVFLPLYFALSGLKTEIGSLNDAISWAMVLLVIFVACFGKIIGCTAAARLSKLSWRESFTVGMLMNCKGLVELIVLNLGYDAKVISEKTFAIMVIMALVTTFLTVPVVSYIYPPKYYNKSIQPTSINDPKILVALNKLEQVSPILSIVHLLESKYNHTTDNNSTMAIINPKGNFPCKGKASEKNGKAKNKLVVYAMRLIEITERDSSVMLQTSEDALREDPVMKMIQAFGDIITSLDIRGLVKVVTMSKFAETLTTTATDVNSEFIVVSWSGCGSLMEEVHSPNEPLFFERQVTRKVSVNTPPRHANFVQDLLSKNSSNASILVLVNRGLEVVSNFETMELISMPFFGGADDRKALEVIIGMAGQQGIHIKIVRFRNMNLDTSFETSPKRFEYDVESGLGSEDITIVSSPPEFVAAESEDDEIMNKYFGNEASANGFANVSFSQVESLTPITDAISWLKDLQCKDLIVTGRAPNVNTRDLSFRGADQERRYVLGDVVESILLSGCNASLLVVQK